jgi:hypothetical protein
MRGISHKRDVEKRRLSTAISHPGRYSVNRSLTVFGVGPEISYMKVKRYDAHVVLYKFCFFLLLAEQPLYLLDQVHELVSRDVVRSGG